LIPGETADLSFNRGLHKAIKISNNPDNQKLYNLTLAGWIDLGFNELSASTGANDTWTTVNVSTYPDGVT